MDKTTEPKPDADKQKNVLNIDMLVEDDEFDEFPMEKWTSEDEEAENNQKDVWEDNWDNDDLEDDFSLQLKAEFEKQKILVTSKTS